MATQSPKTLQQHHKLGLQPVKTSPASKGSCFYPTVRQSLKFVSNRPKENSIHMVYI